MGSASAERQVDGKGTNKAKWTLGLEVSVGPPHTITAVTDVQDKHGTEKDMPGYANEAICPGDIILKVDGAVVESKPVATLNRALKGDLNTCVDIELRSASTNKTYSVTALRHARQSNNSPPLSASSPLPSGKENLSRQTPSHPAPWQSPSEQPVIIPQLIQDCPPILSPSNHHNDSNASTVDGSRSESDRTSRAGRQMQDLASRLEKLEGERTSWEEDFENRLDRAMARRMAAVEADMERKIEEAVERRATTMVRYVLEMELQPRLTSAMEDVLHTDRYKDVLDRRLAVIFEDILQGIREDNASASEPAGDDTAPSARPSRQDGDEVKVPIKNSNRDSMGSLPDMSPHRGSVSRVSGEHGRLVGSDRGSVEQAEGSEAGQAGLEEESDNDSLESEVRQMISCDEDEDADGRGPADDGWDGDGCDEQTLQVAVTPNRPTVAAAQWQKTSASPSHAQPANVQRHFPATPSRTAPGLSYVAHYYM